MNQNKNATLLRDSFPANQESDYHLISGVGERARQTGLAGADWYRPTVDRATMKSLIQRSNQRALLDTLLWLGLVVLSGAWFVTAWQADSPWVVVAFLVYAALYCGPADSRWHEAGHGTAFRTRWLNQALYQLASFMVLRRPTRWRWSHARHHTDTLITGLDPEIASPVPAHLGRLLLNCLAIPGGLIEWRKVLLNALGKMDAEETTFIPQMEWKKLYREARLWLLVYATVLLSAVVSGSFLPFFLIGLPSFAGAWLYNFFGLTQHAGLPENVTDHRLNCRTVYMNPLFRFLYWNMNYHLEHHLFPMVPYSALPRLHQVLQPLCPPAYPGVVAAYWEILSALKRQSRDPHYYVLRPLPEGKGGGK